MKNKKASAIGGVKQKYIHMANSMRKHPINTVTHITLLNLPFLKFQHHC